MKKIILFISVLFICSFHDFHMTHTTLYHNPSLGNVEVTVKVAIEDLERSLQNESSEKLGIGTEKENQLAEKLIPNYFNKHLILLINNEMIKYEYLGKEINKNLHDIYLYFEIRNLDKIKINSINIENTLFLEISPNQTNIVLGEFHNQNFNLTFTKDLKKKKLILNN
jgi:DNA-dependent RNA polymerase auxiliary subunit epsilon